MDIPYPSQAVKNEGPEKRTQQNTHRRTVHDHIIRDHSVQKHLQSKKNVSPTFSSQSTRMKVPRYRFRRLRTQNPPVGNLPGSRPTPVRSFARPSCITPPPSPYARWQHGKFRVPGNRIRDPTKETPEKKEA